VPEAMFDAFVVSVVAEVANGVPLVLVTVKAPPLARVASPLMVWANDSRTGPLVLRESRITAGVDRP
jgi:hypothetical protein